MGNSNRVDGMLSVIIIVVLLRENTAELKFDKRN